MRVPVRATVNLPGLGVGYVKMVDPADPYIAGLIKGRKLVQVDLDTEADVPESVAEPAPTETAAESHAGVSAPELPGLTA